MHSIDLLMMSALRPGRPAEERRRFGDSGAALLRGMLDEIDYGLLLVTASGELRYANQLARQELGSDGPLQTTGPTLRTRAEAELGRLQGALTEAARGRRTLVTLGYNGHALLVAVIPMGTDEGSGHGAGEQLALLVFSKRASCAALTVDFYARSNHLTAAESTVLLRLSEGLAPKEIAQAHGVALSTVRSQITSIRTKTQTGSIGELARRVAALPPFAPALKAALSTTLGHQAQPRPTTYAVRPQRGLSQVAEPH